MDPNPYESPRVEQPLKRSQMVKRGVGLAAILLLTPPAMIVAVLTCCTAGRWFPAIGALIAFGGPFALLTGLMACAAYFQSTISKGDPNSTKSSLGIFVATPIFVALASVVGFVFAAFAYALQDEWAIMVAFFLPPAVTLLWMLRLAWRSR